MMAKNPHYIGVDMAKGPDKTVDTKIEYTGIMVFDDAEEGQVTRWMSNGGWTLYERYGVTVTIKPDDASKLTTTKRAVQLSFRRHRFAQPIAQE
jgi:hypothetical protein